MENPFVGQTYHDGDKDWDAPQWRLLMDKELVDGDQLDFEREREKHSYVGQNEVGLKHPITGATIKLKDDGCIELLANEDTGILLNPKDNSIIFFGDSVHIASKDTHIHTRPNGFAWNYHTFNPFLYYEDETHKAPSFRSDTGKDYKILERRERKWLYDEKMNSILSNLGIEVERR